MAIDDDLFTEILLHLPLKSLLVFKSVSKKWLNLISNQHFTRYRFLCNYPSISGIFLYQASIHNYPEYEFIPLNNSATKPPFKSLTTIPDPSGVIIQHSCNGLLCCSSSRASLDHRSYFIYNPSTMQYATLPRPHAITSNISSVSLAFDPAVSPHYKVVCIWRTGESYQIEIYNSEISMWNLCGQEFTGYVNQGLSRPGVFWAGALHWIVGNSFLRFDVNSEILLSMLPMPTIPDAGGERRLEYFGASNYRFYLIERYGDRNKLHFLEMERECSCWNVKYCIILDELTKAYPEMVRNYLDVYDWNHYAFSVLAVTEEEDSSCLILHIPSKVICFNLKNNMFKKLKDLSPGIGEIGPYLQYRSFDSFQYIETLASV